MKNDFYILMPTIIGFALPFYWGLLSEPKIGIESHVLMNISGLFISSLLYFVKNLI